MELDKAPEGSSEQETPEGEPCDWNGGGLVVCQGALRKGSIGPLATRTGGRGSYIGVMRGPRWERRLVRRIAAASPGSLRSCSKVGRGRGSCRRRFSFCLRRSSERIAEDIVDFFVPRIVDEIVARIISQERVHN